MILHLNISTNDLLKAIKRKDITFAGWTVGKIYGHLNCVSGKNKIKAQNRVFFSTEQDATNHDYRPCAVCMKDTYKQWKSQQNI
ncbi:MAG: methylphosphotriester-DNA--protein-cysteine methyltransferase [Alphaproteobacteria bacterium]|jgi:methylphosphotriester-DNA--protein-cysteine methyltransferase